MAMALWGTIASLLWIFCTKAESPWQLWWVPFI